VLALVDLVQDLDVLLPVLLALRADPELELKVVVSRWLQKESPRTEARLRAEGIDFRYVRRRDIIEDRAPGLGGISAVLAASESSHPAHAAGYALAARARGLGLRTYSLQHGFEQIGLFGRDAARAEFASQAVFCWFPPEATPSDLPEETRAKLAHVGRPAPPGGWGQDPAPAYDLGVFENLHWDRYSDDDRAAFRAGLFAVAQALPQARILLRPHPAGGWADSFGHELAQFENIRRLGASEGRARLEGGGELLRSVSRVITTPSTIALDAALAGAPTALAAPGGGAYAPLPTLENEHAWVAFASGAAYDPGILDQFRARVLVAGDGAPRLLERVKLELVAAFP
jgi:hypothetical protein